MSEASGAMASPFRPAPDRDPAFDIDRAVLQLIRDYTKGRTITRSMLESQVPLMVDRERDLKDWDREIRKAIARLRAKPVGSLICSSSGSQGYWWARTPEELKEHCREERRAAASRWQRVREQERVGLQQFEGEQMELFR